MCGGCNVLAEGAGASIIMARYWWVARQGRKAVAEAETILIDAPLPVVQAVADPDTHEAFIDPLDDVLRVSPHR